MDRFFTQRNCDRCGKDLKGGRIMSMFNEDYICLDCREKETKDKDYQKAREAELEEVTKGNYNFKGIGRNIDK
ncbi:hypothetical protein [Tissierella sp.]|uniref:hypothetical protein n=1 Tax=Tissierella sp. TaxID=41274 RepID=UPI0030592E87